MNAQHGQTFPVQAMPNSVILSYFWCVNLPYLMAEHNRGDDDPGAWLEELLEYNRVQAISLKRLCFILCLHDSPWYVLNQWVNAWLPCPGQAPITLFSPPCLDLQGWSHQPMWHNFWGNRLNPEIYMIYIYIKTYIYYISLSHQISISIPPLSPIPLQESWPIVGADFIGETSWIRKF